MCTRSSRGPPSLGWFWLGSMYDTNQCRLTVLNGNSVRTEFRSYGRRVIQYPPSSTLLKRGTKTEQPMPLQRYRADSGIRPTIRDAGCMEMDQLGRHVRESLPCKKSIYHPPSLLIVSYRRHWTKPFYLHFTSKCIIISGHYNYSATE